MNPQPEQDSQESDDDSEPEQEPNKLPYKTVTPYGSADVPNANNVDEPGVARMNSEPEEVYQESEEDDDVTEQPSKLPFKTVKPFAAVEGPDHDNEDESSVTYLSVSIPKPNKKSITTLQEDNVPLKTANIACEEFHHDADGMLLMTRASQTEEKYFVDDDDDDKTDKPPLRSIVKVVGSELNSVLWPSDKSAPIVYGVVHNVNHFDDPAAILKKASESFVEFVVSGVTKWVDKTEENVIRCTIEHNLLTVVKQPPKT